jgi:hypothetical protein
MPRSVTVTKIATTSAGNTVAHYTIPADPGDPNATPPVPPQSAGTGSVIIEPPHEANFRQAFAGAPDVKITFSGVPVDSSEITR